MRRQAGLKIGAAVGSGVVARAAEAGGADFLLAINAGRMRNMGLPSITCMLPIRDATDATLPFAEREVLPNARVPVFVGLTDWSIKGDEGVIRKALDAGFAGAVNFPSAMHYSSSMRQVLDRAGMGTQSEISMLRRVQSAGGRTLFYCGTLGDVRAAADASLDAVVFNFGWNVGGADSHTAEITLEEAALRAREVALLARRVRPQMEVYLEGGPILTADDLNFVIRHADIDGYVGGSTIDRFPVQHSVANQIAEYKSASLAIGARAQEQREALTLVAKHGLWGHSDELADFAVSLVRARDKARHIFLTAPKGADIHAALNVLTQRRGRQRLARFDFAQSPSAHMANDILFGRADGGAQRPGLLFEDVDFVVLYNSAQMPRLIRRKLKNLIDAGRASQIGGRVSYPVTARLILVSDQEPPEGWGDVRSTLLRFPSLHERHLDVRMILEHHFANMVAEDRIPDIRPAAFRILAANPWPGNDAELRRIAETLTHQTAKRVYEAHDIQQLLSGEAARADDLTSDEAKRQQILLALTRNGFRKADTARSLNISRKTLYNQIKKFGL